MGCSRDNVRGRVGRKGSSVRSESGIGATRDICICITLNMGGKSFRLRRTSSDM